MLRFLAIVTVRYILYCIGEFFYIFIQCIHTLFIWIRGRFVVRTESDGEKASVVAGKVQVDLHLPAGPAAVGQSPCGVTPPT